MPLREGWIMLEGGYVVPACPKPEPRATEKRKRDRGRSAKTSDIYDVVFDRDKGRCRIPGCNNHLLEMAHLLPKGMGGDHGLRTTTTNCAMLCRPHHQGTRSLHSGHLKYQCLTDRGADGPMLWEIREHI